MSTNMALGGACYLASASQESRLRNDSLLDERELLYNIVDEKNNGAVTIVAFDYRFETFLSSCVPDL